MHPYRNACGIGYAPKKLFKNGSYSAGTFQQLVHRGTINIHGVMANCMPASVFLAEMQYFNCSFKYISVIVVVCGSQLFQIQSIACSCYILIVCTYKENSYSYVQEFEG